MKKLLALLVALLLLPAALACAETVDLSYVLDRSDSIYHISTDAQNDCAFISTQLSIESRAFPHVNESIRRYSYTKFDILLTNCSTPAQTLPMLRLWVVCCSDADYPGVTSVTFDVAGKRYTFTDVITSGNRIHDEYGYRENVLIRFGLTNIDFLLALESVIPNLATIDSTEALSNLPITMTLHGKQDIVVPLDAGFCLDFQAMKDALIQINGLAFFSTGRLNPTPMTAE